MSGPSLEAPRWARATLPLAPASFVMLLLFEWLFIITRPSATAGLAFSEQLRVLVESPLPALVPLLALQAAASLLSMAAYPRIRFVALVPAAIVIGGLMLLLIDNFTYTVLGFGILTAGEPLRVVYATLLPVLAALAGWKLAEALASAPRTRGFLTAASLLTVVFLTAPVATRFEDLLPKDRSAPPELGAVGAPGGSRPNVLFLGIDGLDAQLTSAYGYARQTTPFLERFSRDTLFFEHAFTNATRTHGSLVTLLTGRLPFSTRVTFPPTVLRGEDARRNLPFILKEHGYTTLQIGMRHYADAEDVNLFGFDAANYRWQGGEVEPYEAVNDETDVFRAAVAERVDQRLGALYGVDPIVDGFAHVEGRAVSDAWKDERRVTTLTRFIRETGSPWFVHLHLLDTHCCVYRPAAMHFRNGPDGATDARDSQILETDAHVQRIVEALEAVGQLERTVVVVSSDHASRWKATERVPLMIRFPAKAPAGRVSPNVQIADVAPTILDYLGAPIPDWMDGVSLLEPARLPANRPIFGVSDIKRREGPSGSRLLLDSGPPNFGASAAMLIAGRRWYELSLVDGEMKSGEVGGHTGPETPALKHGAARSIIERRLTPAGFRVERDRQTP